MLLDSLMIDARPLSMGAGALFEDSPGLRKRYAFKDAFGETFFLYQAVKGGHVLMPRGLIRGESQIDTRVSGLSAKFGPAVFAPRNPEQARVVDEITAKLLAGESFIVEAPTGFGKTVCMVEVLRRLGKLPLIIVTKGDILTQWRDAFVKFAGVNPNEVGRIQGDTVDVANKKAVIGMVQSLHKWNRYPRHVLEMFGLVVFDEVHNMAAPQFSKACWQLPGRLRIGLSATPTRRDGRDLVFRSHIGPIAVRTKQPVVSPIVLLRRSGWHVPNRVTYDKLTGQQVLKPIPHKPGRMAHIFKMMASSTVRNNVIVEFVERCYARERAGTVVFSDLKEAHLNVLYAMLRQRGIPSADMAYYIGGLTEAQRDEAKRKRVVLATYKMASEATDVPWWDSCVLGTPKSDVKQIVGRVLREYPGKKRPVVLDLLDGNSAIFDAFRTRRRTYYREIKADQRDIRV